MIDLMYLGTIHRPVEMQKFCLCVCEGEGGGDFIKKCWPGWLVDLENRLIKIV